MQAVANALQNKVENKEIMKYSCNASIMFCSVWIIVQMELTHNH